MNSKIRNAGIAILLFSAACLGQSRYNNQIQPGLSTRSDVDQALGQPLRAVNATLFEYAPPPGGSRLTIQYRNGSNVVEVIELDFSKTYSRASMIQSLKLPDQPDATTVNHDRLVEYFGGGKCLALAYAAGETSSGVNVLGYLSREIFERTVAGLKAQPHPASGAKPSLSGGAPAPGAAQTSETQFRVKLLTPISTQTSKKGDKITAQVLEPQTYSGDILEGTIHQSKSGGKVNGKSVLNFSFQTLDHAGQALPVQADVKSVVNSKGQPNVDEEGQIVKKKNNLGKIAAGTAVGALIGGLAGGGKGAAIGAGVGAGASLVLVEVAAEGANVSFAPGSEFVLSVKSQNR